MTERKMNNSKRKCKICGKSEFARNMHRTILLGGDTYTMLCDGCYQKLKRRVMPILCKDCVNLDTEKCPFYTSTITNDLFDFCSRAKGREA